MEQPNPHPDFLDFADSSDEDVRHGAQRADERDRREQFLHRMNQVRIGGHQADRLEAASVASSGSHEAASSASTARPPAPPSTSNDAPRSTSGFPAYTNNVVLATVSVPFSEQFPVKDADIGPRHFTRLKLLGRGGIGQVFLVRLKDTDKLYAMKVLTKEEMIQRNKVKRVMTEREILATANHPFIVTMYASFQTADRLCFVMEYCAGGEFFRVLQRQPRRRLKEDAVRFYAAEVILALEYLHHMGFIYRDLKPENILMRENGHIALTDFDLSKQAHAVSPRVIQQQLSLSDKIRKSLSISTYFSFILITLHVVYACFAMLSSNRLFMNAPFLIDVERNNSSLNNLEIVDSEPVLTYQTNSFVGTEEYIAPEVVNGVGQSSAVDWWTLGILIYEMITGTTPFKGSYTDETFSNIVHEQLKWPDDINVSAECKQLVKKLLRREAAKRLGAENGASDIKRSKWFKDVNFALIRVSYSLHIAQNKRICSHETFFSIVWLWMFFCRMKRLQSSRRLETLMIFRNIGECLMKKMVMRMLLGLMDILKTAILKTHLFISTCEEMKACSANIKLWDVFFKATLRSLWHRPVESSNSLTTKYKPAKKLSLFSLWGTYIKFQCVECYCAL